MNADDWLKEVYNAFDGECMFIEHTLQTSLNDVTIQGRDQGGIQECALWHLERYKDVIRHIERGDHVLSVGAGGGLAERAYFIASRRQVVTIDLEKSTRMAELLYPCPGITRIVADVSSNLPVSVYEYAPYDIVVMTEVYEHISEEQGIAALSSLAQLAADDAKFIVSCPIHECGEDPNHFHVRVFRSVEEVEDEFSRYIKGTQSFVFV